MAKNNNLTDFLKSIADKLRSKLNNTAPINPQNFEAKIDDVYAKGQDDKMDAFWDMYQNNGDRKNYDFAFASSLTSGSGAAWGGNWTSQWFQPKYTIKPLSMKQMMYNACLLTENPFKCSVSPNVKATLDTSRCVNFYWPFGAMFNAGVTCLPVIDTRAAKTVDPICPWGSITKIDKVILKDDGSQQVTLFPYNGSPTNIERIKDVVFEGMIGSNIDWRSCPYLTHDSLMSAINALKDYSGGTTHTFKLHATALARLSDSEIAVATTKGWTVTS